MEGIAIGCYVSISTVIHHMCITQMIMQGKKPLRVLGRYFAYKSSKDTLNCFFEEYDVSRPDLKWDVYELIQESVSMVKLSRQSYHHLELQSSRVLQRSSSLFLWKRLFCVRSLVCPLFVHRSICGFCFLLCI